MHWHAVNIAATLSHAEANHSDVDNDDDENDDDDDDYFGWVLAPAPEPCNGLHNPCEMHVFV